MTLSSQFVDYYQVLGYKRSEFKYDPDDLKKRWREGVINNHPDTHPDDPEAKRKTQDINEAYAVLRNESQRQKYNEIYAKHQKEDREAEVRETIKKEAENSGRPIPKEPPKTEPTSEQEFMEFRKSFYRDLGLNKEWATELDNFDKFMEGVAGVSLHGNGEQAEMFARAEVEQKLRDQARAVETESATKANQEQQEGIKSRFEKLQVVLPENDRYAVMALMKLKREKETKVIDVKDERGEVVWHIENKPAGAEVKRSITAWVDPKTKPAVHLKEGSLGMFQEPETTKPTTELFTPAEINRIDGEAAKQIPNHYDEYARDLQGLATDLYFAEAKSEIKPEAIARIEGRVKRINEYNEKNREPTETREKVKLTEVIVGLNESRLSIQQKVQEGKPPIA